MRESHEKRINMREKLVKEQNNICPYCKKPIQGKASIDHIVPVDRLDEAQGDENLLATCIGCNKRKGNHIVVLNLFDREYYPLVDIPYFFHYNDIIYNHKDKK